MRDLVSTRVCCFLLITFCFLRANATDTRTHVWQYGHTAWRVQDGVLNAAPYVIVQSKDGYVWIGTETGLLRFDGVRFVQWTPTNWEQLIDPQIYQLFSAGDGTLWISTRGQLASWRDGKLTVVPSQPGIGFINQFAEDSEKRVWFAATRRTDHKSLCEWEKNEVKCLGQAEGLPLAYGTHLIANSDGSLTVTSSDTVVRWNPQHGLISSYTFPQLANFAGLRGISAVREQADGGILVGIGFAGSGLGLERLKDRLVAPYKISTLEGSTLVPQTLFTDREGALWIGTLADGLYRSANGEVDHFDTKDGLSGDSVRDFFKDREGNMWVATDGGIDCFRDLKAVSYNSRGGLPAGLIGSILAARDGQILVGVEQSLEILEGGRITSIDQTKGLPPGKLTALGQDHEGRFWMGVGNDLVSYDGKRFTTVKYADGQSSGAPAAIAVAQDGSIWVTTVGRQRALIHVVDDVLTTVLSKRSSGEGIAADKVAGVWIPETGGLAHYANGTAVSVPIVAANGSTKLPVFNALITDRRGDVFAASGRGIWGVRDGKAQMLGVANGLPCQVANGLSMSKEESLVIRTSCGLLVVGQAALTAWWKDQHASVTYTLIDSFDGAHLSPSTFSPTMSLAPDGRIWNGNAGSIQVFDPDHVRSNSVEPPVQIETVVADGKHLTPSEGLILPPLTRDIELDYTALSLSVPQKVRFRFQLEGRDETWQYPGTRRIAFYQNLRPGKYRFHVLAANNDGVWNESGAVLDFSVKAAWVQTLWFRLLSITMVVVLITVLYRLRVRALAKAINARFDERLDERTRMALELHDTFLQTVQGSKMVADDALDATADQVRMRHALEKLSVWLEQAIMEGRAALHALRVTTTERNHLAEFLERTAKEHCGSKSISVALTVIGDARDLHPIVRDEITRISEEAIRNACLHSKASQLSIELRYASDLTLSFKDNGIGIDPEVVDVGKEGHFGIQGMRERSARLHARITIKSTLNAGTAITLQVPGAVVYRYGNRSLWTRILRLWRGRNAHLDKEESDNGGR